MLLIRKSIFFILVCCVAAVLLSFTSAGSIAGKNAAVKVLQQDTIPSGNYGDSLHFPIHDRQGDFISGASRSPYDFSPSNIKDSVVYDAINRRYILYEKIGERYYRIPATYSFDEYWQMRNRQAEVEYFKRRANTTSLLNRNRFTRPKLSLTDNLFNRLFGNGKIDISPQGNVDLTAGYQGQRIDNPTLPERARKNGGLDFNMNAQVNVNASIGDKMKFPINYNTLANFDLENQLKLDYSGKDDEILKRFEAGNVSFPSRGTLIPGAQQLFGLKTQLQFGKLFITTILANQKSQRQSMDLQGGAASQVFEIKADEYEENRHFLIGQYFRNRYNAVMSNLPAVVTPVQILRMEVWVTNKNGTTTETRDVVGLMDLGERQPYLPAPTINVLTAQEVPSNNTNDLYQKVLGQPDARNPAMVFNNLVNLGLSPVQDFEKTFARKLDSTQYSFNRQAGIGTLSLSQPLQTDEVLAVAYQYSFNGRIYQVGEFSQDVPPDSTSATQKVLFLKMLKATSQRPTLPIWNLMMKNVYSIGYGVLTPSDFKLDVLYQEPGLGTKRYVPFGDRNQGTPIITLINLDRLNNQLDPQPDGVFDYVENFTVVSPYSRIIFPVLEPFGRDLAQQVYTTIPGNVRDTVYYALYDSIKAVAQQYPNLNRFVLKGSAKTSGSSDISIGYNIPVGSVSVTAGGRTLQEGVDYDVNYDLGTIKITNQAILNAGLPVQVNSENNASFGLQQRAYMGLRLDYLARNTAKEQFSIGGTVVRLSERPFFTKVSYGEDPIRNAMYGLDVNYRRDMPRLTKLVDKLPFYNATGPSNINVYAEGAMLDPGHAPQIGRGKNGIVNIDDFEGSKSGIDLRFPPISWALASTPYGATDRLGNLLFPEAALNNSLDYGKKRSKIAWYQIEQTLQNYQGTNNPISDPVLLSDPRSRQVFQKEIFPQRTTGFGESQLVTFDLSYFPKDKGPYNFESSSAFLNANNKFTTPARNWGGLMRAIDQPDFETANIEFIEFWMQDPFISTPQNPNIGNSTGGKLYFNLGNVAEDVLKDGRRFYENGLPTPNAPAPVDSTVWGVVPRNPIQVTTAFSNVPEDRLFQDVGFDGLDDAGEKNKRQAYLAELATAFGTGSKAYQDALIDPSSDNYRNYRDKSFTPTDGIIARYKNYNSPQGNSPISDGGEFSSAATLYPDAEDLNRDNTLNETEEYFQYIVDIKPNIAPEMSVGTNYIVDKKLVTVNLPTGVQRSETWYQFRIPIGSYNKKIGNIPDFKSIRFIRMFLTGFEDSVTMRFGTLQLTRNIWRKFQYAVDSSGLYTPPSSNDFNVGAVNIEENDKRVPLPYRTPREIQRVQTLSNNGVNLLQNEQALQLQFCDLVRKDAKAVIQTFANRDLRQFRKLQMYLHAERSQKSDPASIKDKDLTAVIRMGTDFVSNYYEIRIPLILTPHSAASLNPDSDEYNDTLWNPLNSLDVDLLTLTRIKQARNLSSQPIGQIFRQVQENGQIYSVMGSPNLGEIKGVLIGVENSNGTSPVCGEVWANELRLSSLDEKGGYAALARVDLALSDLGTVSVSANMHSSGFGTLEQRINDRYRDNFLQFDVAANLELGKLLPKSTGISIPVYAAYTQSTSTPEYDPYDQDLKLKDKTKNQSRATKDSIRNAAIDFTSITTLNFTNVRKNRTTDKKPKIYDIENFDVSYSYIKTSSHNPLIEYNDVVRHRAALGYNFAPRPRYFEPFKKVFAKTKHHWFDLLKDFNLNLRPSQLAFRADLSRQFGVIRARSVGTSKYAIPETYDKYFVFQRDYIMRWTFNRSGSLALDYTATNNSRVDEPFGRLDTKEKRDTMWQNLLRGGRNTLFNQTANFSYALPTSKLPLTDWTTVNLKYQAAYRWIGASRLAVELGNIIENGQQKEANMQLDFNRLYQKSKWLKQLDVPSKDEDRDKWKNRITKVRDSVTLKSGKKVVRTRRIVDQTAVPYLGTGARVFGKLLTSIKNINVTYSEDANTRLPGYMDSTQFFGENFRSGAPGFDFILGHQPDTNWLNRKAAKGLITKDTNFNYLFQQSYNQRLTLNGQVEPVRDLIITVNLTKSFNKSYNETFRFIDTTGGTNRTFQHLNPYTGGSFDVSYIAFKTLFGKFDPNRVSETFKTFEANRIILSRRLGQKNPYTQAQVQPDGYYLGYTKYAVDVLIPSFIAAYTGQNPENVSLIKQSNANTKSNPFKNILPRPNWKLDYNGLTRVKGFDKVFTNFTLSHGYNGSLSMNGFTSALLYQDVSQYGYPSFLDTVSNNFIPFFLVPNVTIQEQFGPLVGFDMMFVNQLQAKFEYTKSRTLSLSLYDYQLSEVRSTEFVIGAGYRKRGLKLLAGLKLPKFLDKDGKGKLDNEINFRLDLRIRDNVTANSRLDQDNNFATGGSKEITITPTIDYFLNNRVNLKLYFDQRRVTPYISSSAPTVNTRAGVQVRISLAQ